MPLKYKVNVVRPGATESVREKITWDGRLFTSVVGYEWVKNQDMSARLSSEDN